MKKLDLKFWSALLIFGLAGQIAWTVENMYLNVFIYKLFHASSSDISIMVGLSAVIATLTTWIMGAISDYIGKRKLLICGGYILWGISILGFRFISTENMMVTAATLGIQLAIILDCLMTFFGSTANDASFNAWLTDKGDQSNRGNIEGINSILPILSMIVVFGAFMNFNLDLADSWQTIFTIIGCLILIIGLFGLFLIDETSKKSENSFKDILFYSLRKDIVSNNKMLYATLIAFCVFATSIQVFMPYLILYFEVGLGLENYVLIFAPATLIAAILTTFLSKIYDLQGIQLSSTISVTILMIGYLFMIFFTNTPCVFIGTLFIMIGYMTTLAIFLAEVRNRIPENCAGQFQGIRMICQVLIPGVVGPMIGSILLSNAEQILNNDGTYSFVPNRMIFIGALAIGFILIYVLNRIFEMIRREHYDLLSDDTDDFIKSNELPWQEHPTPQMKRKEIYMLNGIWKLENEEILVPFPPQSYLSNYKGEVKDEMTYEKSFKIPSHFNKDKILLHFGAVDQICDVYVNDKYVGHHEGGYLPFSFDISEFVNKGIENKIQVKVKDTLSIDYPYGKQTKKRGGMWYTPVSGIWQSVWLENVCENYIEKIKITPSTKGVKIVLSKNIKEFKVRIKTGEGRMCIYKFSGFKGSIQLNHPILWTCENPFLYYMTIYAGDDEVETYFALRTIGYKTIDGVKRVVLNGKPIFMHGLLDQGYYCDGIYLPATEKEYERDILRMKELGFNLLRKHIKVEPEAFYYACDRLGMLVMQDFVNNGPYNFIFDTVIPTYVSKKRNDSKMKLKTKTHDIFIEHSKQLVKHLYNHPCIIAYTIFNEGWGQFHSDYVYDLVKQWDSTRLIDSTSGWFAQNKNEFDSEHIYFKQIEIQVKDRPYLISECGGFTMQEKNHIYSKYNTYGYGVCETHKELTDKIIGMYKEMVIPAISKGLCGCIYTQVSDVEDEINGLYTYDRKVCKVIKEDMIQLSKEIKHEINEI